MINKSNELKNHACDHYRSLVNQTLLLKKSIYNQNYRLKLIDVLVCIH